MVSMENEMAERNLYSPLFTYIAYKARKRGDMAWNLVFVIMDPDSRVEVTGHSNEQDAK